MSRRIIEDSDDEAPINKGNNTLDLGPYARHLSQNDGKWTLDNHDELIQLIPVGANERPTPYQMLAIVSALCASPKKTRMALFRKDKAGTVFGDWWDYCLSRLSSSNGDNNGELVLIELLKFTKVLEDTIKKKADLTKAKDRMGADFVSQMEATKKALDSGSGANALGEVKAQFALVEKHFLDLYQVQIGSPSVTIATPAAQVDKSAPPASEKPVTGGDNSAATNADLTAEDRKKAAAAEKRIVIMKNSQKKRAVMTSSPTKLPVAAPALSSNATGSSGHGAANNILGAESSKNVSAASRNSAGSSRPPAEATDRTPAKPTASTGIVLGNDSTEGWGRHPEQTKPQPTNTEKMTLHCNYNDTRPWGALNQANPYQPSREPQGSSQPNQRDNRMPRDSGGHDSRLNDARNSGHGHSASHASRDYRANDSSRQQYQGSSDLSRNNDRYDPQPNRQPSSYGSREYGSKESAHSGAYDSSRQPHSGRNDSSDHEPYPRGGNIRNNQPGGGYDQSNQYAPRRDDPGYRGSDMQQQSNQYDSRRDQHDMNHGRRSSHDYDRRDSRTSSYQSGSSDRRYDDRKDPADRPYRSGSPPRDDRNSRRFEDDRRDNNDRYDDRKRHDRDDSFRRSDSRGGDSKVCKYFFTDRGCRNGASCRFSHQAGDDRKPPADRRRDRGSYGRNFEDNGSEDGEVRPAKRFKGPDISSANNSSTAQPSTAAAGRGMGRGAHVNKPAWMTKTDNGPGPTGAPVASSSKPAATYTSLSNADLASSSKPAATYASLSNADLANVLSSVTGNAPSISSAGRGRGRGKTLPAWMTKNENNQPGPSGVAVPPVVNGMNGRFAPPPGAQNNIPPQPAMGRGRGRGTDNRPAWMTQREK